MDIIINNSILKTHIIPVFEFEKKVNFFDEKINKDLKNKILKQLKLYNFTGKNESSILFNIDSQKIILIGIKKEYNLENLRKCYSKVFSLIQKNKDIESSFELSNFNKVEIKSIVEGIDLTNYKFDKYISKNEDKNENLNFKFYFNTNLNCNKLIEDTLIIGREVKFVRNLVNENASILTPKKFEELTYSFAKKYKLKIKVLDEKKIKKEKLGLLKAVGQGANNPPRLIILEYSGDKQSKEKIALVGKGITFDTGGINIKPTGYIEDMKTDMGGAAAVFGAFRSAVELKLKKNLILVISSAENSVSASAYLPGDIFTSYSGVTVEIGNTDAEGRLVLADAISYVQKNYKPTTLIDMATLTGACLVALGPNLIACLGNDDKLKKEIFKSGEETFEQIWEFPIYDEHRDLMKSKFADLKNNGGRYGGTITAAAFLEKFVEEDIKWVHLDIAGAARSRAGSFGYYVPEFGTGKGVRLIVDYLQNN